MSVLPISYYESDVGITNISQSLEHIMAGKQLALIWYEEITSLSPYVYTFDGCSSVLTLSSASEIIIPCRFGRQCDVVRAT